MTAVKPSRSMPAEAPIIATLPRSLTSPRRAVAALGSATPTPRSATAITKMGPAAVRFVLGEAAHVAKTKPPMSRLTGLSQETLRTGD